MIHVHSHQETLDPFRISHSSVFKELRLRTTRICVTLGKQILQILQKLVLLMMLGFLIADRTAYV